MIINFDQRYISGINHVLEFLNGVMPRVLDKRHFIGGFLLKYVCVSGERGVLLFIGFYFFLFKNIPIPFDTTWFKNISVALKWQYN